MLIEFGVKYIQSKTDSSLGAYLHIITIAFAKGSDSIFGKSYIYYILPEYQYLFSKTKVRPHLRCSGGWESVYIPAARYRWRGGLV